MMGSAASSKVKDISLNVNNLNSKSNESSSRITTKSVPDGNNAKSNNITSQSDRQSEPISCASNEKNVCTEQNLDSYQSKFLMERIKMLETELANVQSLNMDYEDQIKDLREQALNNDGDQHNADIKNILQSNHLRIAELEEEKENSKAEYAAINIKLRRRVKVLKARLSESRQMFLMEKMEMSDTIKQLKENNENMQRKETVHELDNISTQNSDRMNLVVELSSQVSEQSQFISELQNSVAEKDKEIEQLKLLLYGKERIEETHATDCWAMEAGGKPDPSVRNKYKKTYKHSNSKERRQKDSEVSWVKASSNSDSDWSIQSEFISSKIHSAPPGIRAGAIF